MGMKGFKSTDAGADRPCFHVLLEEYDIEQQGWGNAVS